MYVSRLEIRNFRGVHKGDVPLKPLSVLIGPNNCGKTTITEALALVLGRDRLIRPLTEHDFFGSTPVATDRVTIIATLTGFTTNDPDHHHDWFRHGRAVVKWEDAETGKLKPTYGKATDRLACQIAYCARFDHDTLEMVTARYFYDADVPVDPFNEESPAVTVPGELIRQIGFFLVPASRTWDRTISFGSELFRRVVSYVGGKPAVAVLAERDRLRKPEKALEADDNLSTLVSSVNADLKTLFGQPLQLKLRVTSTDSDSILEATTPHFGEEQAVPLPARRYGSGLISLQTLILLMRFGKTRAEKGEGFMMVIEEPELHVPPPLQRKLLRLMQSMATQTIVTTHSPTVASVPDPHQVGLVVNSKGEVNVRALIDRPLPADATNPLRRLFLTDRDATVLALMHSRLMIPEGRTEGGWLRLFVKCLELQSAEEYEAALAFSHEVGVVPTPDARTTETYRHLCSVHPSIICLFDGDQSGSNYTTAVCQLTPPPHNVVRWPQGWEIEDIVAWIVAGDETVLASPELVAAGVPQSLDQLLTLLKDRNQLKINEVVHGLLVDAMTSREACRLRIAHVLRLLADLASGRAPLPSAATSVAHANGITTIWTFNHAFSGI